MRGQVETRTLQPTGQRNAEHLPAVAEGRLTTVSLWPPRPVIVLAMIEAVLFEFDGVIADTRLARRRALMNTIEGDGIALTDDEYVECCAGLPIRAAIRAAYALRGVPIDDTGVELAGLRADRRFAALVETGISLVEGAQAAIEALQGSTRLGIVSRAARRDIDQALMLAQLDHAFEFIIADDDPYPPKPSGASYVAA
jgi:beta-phosphoglucomutase-like phosphatase (HAD superfamily)